MNSTTVVPGYNPSMFDNELLEVVHKSVHRTWQILLNFFHNS
jgi:hypothetical protein